MWRLRSRRDGKALIIIGLLVKYLKSSVYGSRRRVSKQFIETRIYPPRDSLPQNGEIIGNRYAPDMWFLRLQDVYRIVIAE